MKLSLTLATVSPDDAAFAQDVARQIARRTGARVRVVAAGRLSPEAGADAIVSRASPAHLDRDLRACAACAGVPDEPAQRRLCLIHPQPEAGHYAYALRHGLLDVIAWPAEAERYCATIDLPAGPNAARSPQHEALRHLIGASPVMAQLRARIAKLAVFDSNVLLVGETGVGKEEVVRAIHQASRRRHNALVCINCAALPEHLIESELFGYERGAFTGATGPRRGKFAAAEGGTLFLDEVGEMPPAAQAKILRAIENREYFPLGATEPRASDVRLVAATHRDLDVLCERGEFRLDLYFRLNVARLEVPPLRAHRADIACLANHFLREIAAGGGRSAARRFSAEALAVLRRYDWPGNIRELRNAVETAVINAECEAIGARDLPARLTRWSEQAASPGEERMLLASVLKKANWNKSQAARALNWSRMKLYRKLERYRLGEGMEDRRAPVPPPDTARGR